MMEFNIDAGEIGIGRLIFADRKGEVKGSSLAIFAFQPNLSAINFNEFLAKD